MRETRSRTISGPRRFMGGAAISAKRTAPSLRTLSVSKTMDFGSALFGHELRLRFPVRMETCLVALLPGCALIRAADVPIGTAALQHRAQVEAQFLHRRPAEEPVAVVDLVDAQAGLEHPRVRDHRIVMRVGVFGDIEILL